MRKVRFVCLALALVLLWGLADPSLAAVVDCDTVFCYASEEFAHSEQTLSGICITGHPDSTTGTVMLGSRVLRTGGILTARQVVNMAFQPLRTREDREAQVTYLPFYENRGDPAAVMTLSIRGKEDKAPAAQDGALET